MTPAEERACYERAAKVCDAISDERSEAAKASLAKDEILLGHTQLTAAYCAAAIRALPLTIESASAQDTKPQVEQCKAPVPPASAADPIQSHSKSQYKRLVTQGANVTAPAQSSTAYDEYKKMKPHLYRQGDLAQGAAHTLYKDGDKDAPDVIKDSNGSITLGLCRVCGKGACDLVEPCIPVTAPLEPVAEVVIEGHLPDLVWLKLHGAQHGMKLYAIPPGYTVVPVEPTEEMLRVMHDQIDWCREDQNTNIYDHPSQSEDGGTNCRQDLIDAYRAMLTAGRVK